MVDIINRTLGRILISPKTPSININMTNKRYKKTFGPNADYDGDGVRNIKDCRPFDKYRDMSKHEYYECITKDKKKDIVYAENETEAKKIGKHNKKEYLTVRKLSYSEARDILGHSHYPFVKDRFSRDKFNLGEHGIQKMLVNARNEYFKK